MPYLNLTKESKQRVRMIAVFLSVLLGTVAVVHGQEPGWEERYTQASLLYDVGDYPEAIALAEGALDKAVTTHGEDHPSVAKVLDLLAKIHIAQGNYLEAEPIVMRSLELCHADLSADFSAISENLSELANLNIMAGRTEHAMSLIRLERELQAGGVITSVPPMVGSGSGSAPPAGGRQGSEGPPQPPAPAGDPLDAVDRILEQMPIANIAFNTPPQLNLSGSAKIQLLLSLDDTLDVLKQKITEEGEKIGAEIHVSARMEAHLTGNMFDIEPAERQVQAVSRSQDTEWTWEIIPKKKGRHKLHLTLNALLDVDGRETPRKIMAYVREIEVKVTAPQGFMIFFKENWKWLWAALLVPVVGWAIRKLKAA